MMYHYGDDKMRTLWCGEGWHGVYCDRCRLVGKYWYRRGISEWTVSGQRRKVVLGVH